VQVANKEATMKVLVTALTAALTLMSPGLEAQELEPTHRYQLGVRSGFILGNMKLTETDPMFGELGFDGMSGPHISGVYFLYSVTPSLRVGFETLAASSDKGESTTMNYQAAGPAVDLSTPDRLFVAAGLHGGAIIANAMHRQGEDTGGGAADGRFYKGTGFFLSPSAGVGIRFGKNELRVYGRVVRVFGDDRSDGMGGFSGTFGGVSYALGF
jgi:hypothetical protein